MGIDFSRAARGIATGYLTEKIRDTRLADEAKAEDIKFAKRKYMEVDLPNLLKEEKTRAANIKLIDAELGPVFSNYLDNYDIPLSTQLTKQYIDDFKAKNFTDEEKLQIESTISGRKKQRAEDLESEYNAKLDFVKNQESQKPGGSGSKNLMDMFFPGKDKDIADVGIGQVGEQPMATETEEQVTDIKQPMPLRDILGDGNIYDINNPKHLQLEKIASSAFDKQFFDRTQNRYIFSIPADKNPDGSFKDDRYPTLQFIKEGYDDAVNTGYDLGFTNYARDKFVQGVLDRRGIEGFTGTLPSETTTTEATTTTAESKAVPQDGKKFDASNTSQIGVTEKVEPEVVTTGAATGSSAALINDFREFRVRVNDSPSLSEDEKIKKIEQAKERLIGRLTELGTFNESILRQL